MMRFALFFVLVLSAMLMVNVEAGWRIRGRRILRTVADAGVRCGCQYQFPKNSGSCSCNLGKRSLEKRHADHDCSDTVTFSGGEDGFKTAGEAMSQAMEELVNRCK